MNKNILNKYFNAKNNLNVSDDIKYFFYKKNFINIILIFFIFIFYIVYSINNEKNFFLLKQRLNNNSNKFNLKFDKDVKKIINIGIYAFGIKNGGRARSTSLLMINYKYLIYFYSPKEAKKKMNINYQII